MNRVNKFMMISVLSLIAVSGKSFAEQQRPKAQVYYISSSGEKMEPTEGLLAAVKGDEVFKCVPVEPKISKSGTSISLRTKKK